MKPVYFDNGATTSVDKKVLKEMMPYFTEKFGNASSSHGKGHEAKEAMEKSRKRIAKAINAKSKEIYFTSGGTEANNWVLKGVFFKALKSKKENLEKIHIITTKIEHDCVLNACRWLEKSFPEKVEITYLDVDGKGFVPMKNLKEGIKENTVLVSIIHGNNEVGTIQNLESIGNFCREKNVLFHTDACQSFTKTELNVLKQKLDFVTLNSHKIHGPKGVGALYIREEIKDKIDVLMHGGGHEKGFRSGTENIHGIVGFGKAVKLANKKKHIKKMLKIRERLIEGLEQLKDVEINGPKENRLCNNINVRFNDIEGEAIGGYLESKGVYVSTGSACSSHTLEVSHVLTSIGLTGLQANTSIRITISRFTTLKEVEYFLKELPQIINKLRKMSAISGGIKDNELVDYTEKQY